MLKNLKIDRRKRLGFKAQEFLMLLLNYFKKSKNYYLNQKLQEFCFVLKISSLYFRSAFNSFCILSARSKSIFSKYRLSRFLFNFFSTTNLVKNTIKY
jgi:hypothetical protein